MAYLCANRSQFHYPCEALIEAINITFRNNYFKFGDITCKQISGTAIGTPPAPPYATVTFSQHKNQLIPQWTHAVGIYKLFIDDVIGILYVNPDPDLAGNVGDMSPRHVSCLDMSPKNSVLLGLRRHLWDARLPVTCLVLSCDVT